MIEETSENQESEPMKDIETIESNTNILNEHKENVQSDNIQKANIVLNSNTVSQISNEKSEYVQPKNILKVIEKNTIEDATSNVKTKQQFSSENVQHIQT